MKEEMTVLAVGAHPDDIEFLCAGALAMYRKAGHKVAMCHACNGNKGHKTIPPDELGKVRTEESRQGAKIIGAEALTADIGDLEIFVDRDDTLRMVDIIRQAKPDVIITHAPNDYMPDHSNTSQLVRDASFNATVPYEKTAHEAHDKIPTVYFMDTMAGIDFLPTEYVDITEEFETKKEMLLCHQSQHEWLSEHDSINLVEFMETLAKFRGMQCGVRYAEAFRRWDAWGRIPTDRLLPA